MKNICCFVPALLLQLSLFAQSHSDCATALLICSKQSLHIEQVSGSGNDPTELNQATCFANAAPGNFETNSCWIRFTAAQSGSLFLTATPDSTGDDLDFVLFHLVDSNDCQSKQVLRCMAAGSNIGDGPCTGPTGLMPGEIDTTEDAGCTDVGDDNFLAPIDIQAGEVYALCVQNFTTLNGFHLDFCGSALLGCETDVCTALTALPYPTEPLLRLHQVYPNPAAGTFISLDLETEKAEYMTFTLLNMLGQPVRKVRRFVPDGRQLQEFSIDHLASGAYWLQITGGQKIITRSVWIGTGAN